MDDVEPMEVDVEETEMDVYSMENIEQLLLKSESFRYCVIHDHYSEIVNSIKKYYAIDYCNVINSK